MLSPNASLSGRWPAVHGPAFENSVITSTQTPPAAPRRTIDSAYTAPDRWLCRSPPLGMS